MSTKEESLCSSRLLLLPPPPSRLTSSSVKELYRQPIERALQLASGTSAYLDIAVHAPYLAPSSSTEFPSRLHNFDKAQELLVILYSHVSDVLRDADRIKHQEQETDVRIIFYYDASENSVIGPHWSFGPVLSLQSLLSSGRNWGSILLTGTSETAVRKLRESISAMGLPELRYATLIYESNFLEDAEDSVTSQGKEDNKSHSLVAVGGTFDHLHAGHKLLLTMTAFLIQPPYPAQIDSIPRLIIGLTGPELLKNKKHSQFLSSWETRASETYNFLKKIMVFNESSLSIMKDIPRTLQTATPSAQTTILTSTAAGRAPASLAIEIVEINDPFGPTITNRDITALVVSEETAAGGQTVNDKRKEKGWEELEVKVVGVITEGEGTEKMSSTEIRRRKTETKTMGN